VKRVITRPAKTFEQWAQEHGIQVLPDHVLVEVLCGVLGANPTRASRGRWKTKAVQLRVYMEAQARYKAACASGEIPTIEEQVPLDMTKASDQAYARVMEKRLARRKNAPGGSVKEED
jgi:hypothetical protein